MKPVKQEGDMGCGVACVAFLCNVSYRKARLTLFKGVDVEHKGVYCWDIVKALGKCGKKYAWKKAKKKEKILNWSIVFVKSAKYPVGHYLLKTKRGWMDPWINIKSKFNLSVSAAFRKTLPAPIKYVVYQVARK